MIKYLLLVMLGCALLQDAQATVGSRSGGRTKCVNHTITYKDKFLPRGHTIQIQHKSENFKHQSTTETWPLQFITINKLGELWVSTPEEVVGTILKIKQPNGRVSKIYVELDTLKTFGDFNVRAVSHPGPCQASYSHRVK